MRWLAWFTFVVVLSLSACAIQPQKQISTIDSDQWLASHKKPAELQKWQFDGRFSAKTDIENWSGSINWRQNKQQFYINISGPLNSGSAILKGDENFAEFILSDNKTFTGHNAQDLLYQHTGLVLPVNELKFWLLGYPAPDARIDKMTLNERGLLSEILQNNWKVSFKRYAHIGDYQLPNKLFLVNQAINVRLIIQQWRL